MGYETSVTHIQSTGARMVIGTRLLIWIKEILWWLDDDMIKVAILT